MRKIKIDRGIVMPPMGTSSKKKRWIEAIRDMNVGDSFPVHTKMDATTVISSARRIGIKMNFRSMDDGFRVWVTAK